MLRVTLIVLVVLATAMSTGGQMRPSVDLGTGMFEPLIPMSGSSGQAAPHLSLVTGEIKGVWLHTGDAPAAVYSGTWNSMTSPWTSYTDTWNSYN